MGKHSGIAVEEGENEANALMTSAEFTHQLSGTIISSEFDEPVDRASVVIMNPDGTDSDLRSSSSSTGFYQVPTVPQGTRRVVVRHELYKYYEIEIFMSNSDYRLDVTLTGLAWSRDNSTAVVEVTSPTGRIWMDRNLGASRAATSMDDEEAYGDLYQWGREADGHQRRNSPTTTTLSSSDQPGHGSFILSNLGANWDWRSPQNDNLWQGVNGINNPCPSGYRLPTEAEWEAELQSWSSNNRVGAFESPLKLPVAGVRSSSNGSLSFVGLIGSYSSGTVSGSLARDLYFGSVDASMDSSSRAGGGSVRCLKE